ncbi:hypothetical protein LTR60_004129, partial [Cryomyces antarcticus]
METPSKERACQVSLFVDPVNWDMWSVTLQETVDDDELVADLQMVACKYERLKAR